MSQQEENEMLRALVDGFLLLADTEAATGSKAWTKAANFARMQLANLNRPSGA